MSHAIACPTARIVLPGHPDAAAEVSVDVYPFRFRVARTFGYLALWLGSTATALVVTFGDPFLTAIPFILGAVGVHRSWRGRYRVARFHGLCPRCHTPLRLGVGSKISTPHDLVCYQCHHEPHLVLASGDA
jgi:hypothetical protein